MFTLICPSFDIAFSLLIKLVTLARNLVCLRYKLESKYLVDILEIDVIFAFKGLDQRKIYMIHDGNLN